MFSGGAVVIIRAVMVTVVRESAEQGIRYPTRSKRGPRAVITPGNVPSSAIRAVPVIAIEKNVDRGVRYVVDRCPGNDNERRRGMEFICRRRTVEAEVHAEPCIRLIRNSKDTNGHDTKKPEYD